MIQICDFLQKTFLIISVHTELCSRTHEIFAEKIDYDLKEEKQSVKVDFTFN